MKNKSVIRFGGVSAIVSALLYILSLGISMSGSGGNLGTTVYLVSSLFFLGAIVVLYLDIRSQTPMPALAAFLMLAAVAIWSLFLDPTDVSLIFAPLTLIYGLGFGLYGWLQRQSVQYPNGMGITALFAGAIALVAGIALLAGASAEIFGLLNLAMTIPFVVWLVWLGWFYLKGGVVRLQTA